MFKYVAYAVEGSLNLIREYKDAVGSIAQYLQEKGEQIGYQRGYQRGLQSAWNAGQRAHAVETAKAMLGASVSTGLKL